MSEGKRSKLGPKPPPVDLAALDSFAAGALTVPPPPGSAAEQKKEPAAEKRTKQHQQQPPAGHKPSSLPWEEPHVREDVTKQILLRVPEPLYLQLKWLAQKSASEYSSMNQIIMDGTEQLVKKELKKILG